MHLWRLRVRVVFLAGFALVASGNSCGSKYANPLYVPGVPQVYAEPGPLVVFDQAHQNYQSASNEFAPLQSLALAAGFRFESWTTPFDEADLAPVAILIHVLPRLPATASEAQALWTWVAEGGGFLGITDHPDHPVAMQELAADVGVALANATLHHDGSNCAPPLCPTPNSPGWYTFHPGQIAAHPITSGVEYLQSYQGSFISNWPGDAVSLLTLGTDALENGSNASLAGASRAVCGSLGAGRWCFLSEAQLATSKCAFSCTSQISGFGGHVNGVPNAEYDELFLFQMLRWLEGWDGDEEPAP